MTGIEIRLEEIDGYSALSVCQEEEFNVTFGLISQGSKSGKPMAILEWKFTGIILIGGASFHKKVVKLVDADNRRILDKGKTRKCFGMCLGGYLSQNPVAIVDICKEMMARGVGEGKKQAQAEMRAVMGL